MTDQDQNPQNPGDVATQPADAVKPTSADPSAVSTPSDQPVDPAATAAESTGAEPQAPKDAAAAPKVAKPAAAGTAARPPKAPAPPDPRVEAAKATAEQLKEAIVASLGTAAVEESGNAHFRPMVRIQRDAWLQAVEMLKGHAGWQLNYIECMAGTDYSDYIEIVIYIQSTTLSHFVCLKTRTPRDNAEVPSLVPIHPGVNWEEREIFDLLGVRFTNHPDLRRIMMWDEFVGHPLRKDYNEWDGGEENGAH